MPTESFFDNLSQPDQRRAPGSKLPKLRVAAINRWQQAEVFGKEVAPMPEPATFRCGHPRTRANTTVQSPAYATCRQCSQERRKARELLGPASTPAYQQWLRAYQASLPVNQSLPTPHA